MNKVSKTGIKYIYTVTTIREPNKKDPIGRPRTVGWYDNHDAAHEALFENYNDISEEGYYKYGLIEKVSYGVYSFPYEETWYEWNYKTEKYDPRDEKPECFKNIVGFSIG